MNKLHVILGFSLMLGSVAASSVDAQEVPETREYSRKGELSPGTAAPSRAALLSAIENGSPERLRATLEYGERVVCEACVKPLEKKLLTSESAVVRELAAWWLRRQPFAAPHVLTKLRKVVKQDADPVVRARAAEALGEFMDTHALPELTDAALQDGDARVRIAAVRGLARLNSDAAGAVIPDALGDQDPSVKLATLSALLSVGSFRDYAALLPLLGDNDSDVRTRTAKLCGEYRVSSAESVLVAMLFGDTEPSARKAAAWALGRIGGAEGKGALIDAKQSETDARVLNAIDIAMRMK